MACQNIFVNTIFWLQHSVTLRWVWLWNSVLYQILGLFTGLFVGLLATVFLFNCFRSPVNCSAPAMEVYAYPQHLLFLCETFQWPIFMLVFMQVNWLNAYTVLLQASMNNLYICFISSMTYSKYLYSRSVCQPWHISWWCCSVNKVKKYQSLYVA